MKKILVINFRYFGDALISASLSVRIRELWPDAHITYLVFDSVEGVLEGIETIDEILTVPERPGNGSSSAGWLLIGIIMIWRL